MQIEKIQNLFIRANNLEQDNLIKITILNREYWVCGQNLYTNESGQVVKLDLETKPFEEYYCAILVSLEEFETLLEKTERGQKPLHERVFDVIKTLEDAEELQNILFEIYFALERKDNNIEEAKKYLEEVRLGYEKRINGSEPPIVHKMIQRFTNALEKLQAIHEWC